MNYYLSTSTVVAYSREAALVCLECIRRVHVDANGTSERNAEEALDVLAWQEGVNRNDERSYGEEFYKVVFADQVQGNDSCDNCFESIMDTI